MCKQMILIAITSLIPLVAQGQAYKCRTPSGKVVVSNEGCPGDAVLQSITTSAPVSIERQRQAADVAARNRRQLDGIEGDRAAFNQQLQRQAVAIAAEDAAHRQQEGMKNVQRQRDECLELARNPNMPRSQRLALSEICSNPEPNREKFDDCKERLAKAKSISERAAIATVCTGDPNAGGRIMEASRPAPMPAPVQTTITSCDRGGCWDSGGTRYNGSGATLFRTDGKICQKVGNMLQCN